MQKRSTAVEKQTLNQHLRLPREFPIGRAENPVHWPDITRRRVRGLQQSPRNPKKKRAKNRTVDVILKQLENNP